MARLSQGQIIAAVGGIALLVAMFLPWIGVSGASIPSGVPVPSGVAGSTSENIWKGSTLDIYLLITAVAAILPALMAVSGSAEEFSFVSAAESTIHQVPWIWIKLRPISNEAKFFSRIGHNASCAIISPLRT